MKSLTQIHGDCLLATRSENTEWEINNKCHKYVLWIWNWALAMWAILMRTVLRRIKTMREGSRREARKEHMEFFFFWGENDSVVCWSLLFLGEIKWFFLVYFVTLNLGKWWNCWLKMQFLLLIIYIFISNKHKYSAIQFFF